MTREALWRLAQPLIQLTAHRAALGCQGGFVLKLETDFIVIDLPSGPDPEMLPCRDTYRIEVDGVQPEEIILDFICRTERQAVYSVRVVG